MTQTGDDGGIWQYINPRRSYAALISIGIRRLCKATSPSASEDG